MCECNLNDDCCHSYVPFCATIEHVYLFDSELRQLFLSPPLSLSLHLTLPFHGLDLKASKAISMNWMHLLDALLLEITRQNRAFFRFCSTERMVRLQVCFHLKLAEFAFEFFFSDSVNGYCIVKANVCKKWFGNFKVSASVVDSFKYFFFSLFCLFVCLPACMFVFAHIFSAEIRNEKKIHIHTKKAVLDILNEKKMHMFVCIQCELEWELHDRHWHE